VSAFVVVNHLQAKPGKRGQLVELLRDFAVTMHAEPGGVHYSVHQPIGDETGSLTVIQVYSSVAAFNAHSEWMGPQVPRLLPLLAAPPLPPVLHEQVLLSDHPRESFGAVRASG
jgi:quinol monooxygenase YgiN